MGKEKEQQRNTKSKNEEKGTLNPESSIIVLEEEDLTEVDLTLLNQEIPEKIITPLSQSEASIDDFEQEHHRKEPKKEELENTDLKKEVSEFTPKKKISFGQIKKKIDNIGSKKVNKELVVPKPDDTKKTALGRNVRQSSQRDLEQVNEAVVEEIDDAEFEKAIESVKPYDAKFLDLAEEVDNEAVKERQKSKKASSKGVETKVEKSPSYDEESDTKKNLFISDEELLRRLRKIKSKKKLLANNSFLSMVLELDKLLGHLPKDKIESFARSQHYSTYAILMEEVFSNLSEKSK